MVWKREAPQGQESEKIKWEIVQYTRGRGLDIGCGPSKPFAHFRGVDNNKDEALFNIRATAADWIVPSADKLDEFTSSSQDFIFSSHMLEHLPYEDVPSCLKEWFRLLRKGGHLVLYLPSDEAYPKVGEDGANPDHRWNVNYDSVVRAMDTLTADWDLVDFQHRTKEDEYSLFFVFLKT